VQAGFQHEWSEQPKEQGFQKYNFDDQVNYDEKSQQYEGLDEWDQ